MTSMLTDEPNTEQVAYWNGPAGERWRSHQKTQDALLAPVKDLLLERAGLRAGEAILDVGCGCGTTSIELAQRVGSAGEVLAIDVSAPMLARARELAPKHLPIRFVYADATAYPFESNRSDLLFSRFGVMFFAEPHKSFSNMRRALRGGARVLFACWREPRENPWLMLPLQQAYQHVPRLPETAPTDPGPFAFADQVHVRTILESAGFSAIALEPIDLSIDLGAGEGLEAAVETASSIGPASRALEGQRAESRAAAIQAIRSALARYQEGRRVALPAAIWLVSARNPAPSRPSE
jgi:ubiquinone/menaquinone biosynthesis C-methylase UbiE